MMKEDIYNYGAKTIRSGNLGKFLIDHGVSSEYRNGFLKKFQQQFPEGNPTIYEFEKWIMRQENNDCRMAWKAIKEAR